MIPSKDLEWLRSRPESIKKLMRKFPPACYVIATRPLGMPAPGQIGQVMSYFESGLVSVQGRQSIGGVELGFEVRAQCEPEWLEVVGYYYNKEFRVIQDQEWIEEVLK